MYERSLNAAETILQKTEKPWLTVRDLWNQVVQLSQQESFEVAPLAEFTAMLEADARFQIIPARKEDESLPEPSQESEFGAEELEELGFFPEDRVRLKTKPAPMLDEPEVPLKEEEEEVGSIRRRAFVDEVSQAKKEVVKKRKTRVRKPAKKAARKVTKVKRAAKKAKKTKSVRRGGTKKKVTKRKK